jgi:hypothetical protein
MRSNKPLCPDDGQACLLTEEERQNGCWLCPKIQNLRETPYDKPKKEVGCNYGGEGKEG